MSLCRMCRSECKYSRASKSCANHRRTSTSSTGVRASSCSLIKLLRSPPAHQPLQPAGEHAHGTTVGQTPVCSHDYASEVLVNERLFVLNDVAVLQFAHNVDFFLGSLIREEAHVGFMT